MESEIRSISSIYRLFQTRLAGYYDKQEIRQFVNLLFEYRYDWGSAKILTMGEAPLNDLQVHEFILALDELADFKPIQYIIGRVPFGDVELLVASGVLIPRPETLELANIMRNDHLVSEPLSFSLLDIGSGSGNLGISMKKSFPAMKVTLLDISKKALGIARTNAVRNKCEVELIQADILNEDQWPLDQRYDTIVSNPPYVTEGEKVHMHRNVIDHEPAEALFVPDSDPLLFYRVIAEFALQCLSPSGQLYFEINEK
ncbi:MAG: HemK/PrmC family methyltransferase, partial [Bacteroidota bacterium]